MSRLQQTLYNLSVLYITKQALMLKLYSLNFLTAANAMQGIYSKHRYTQSLYILTPTLLTIDCIEDSSQQTPIVWRTRSTEHVWTLEYSSPSLGVSCSQGWPGQGDRLQHEVLSLRSENHAHSPRQEHSLRRGQHQPEEEAGVVPGAVLGGRVRGQVQGSLHHGVSDQLWLPWRGYLTIKNDLF